jgi:hypothetical protein
MQPHGIQRRLAVTAELYEMAVRYWHDVDTNGGRSAAEFYTDDGVFHGEKQIHRGREQIREFYQWREGRGGRLSIHGIINFSVNELTDLQAISTYYMFLYAADGEPILPTAPPNIISLCTDTCVRTEDGEWLYKLRRFKTMFQGGLPTTSMPGRLP